MKSYFPKIDNTSFKKLLACLSGYKKIILFLFFIILGFSLTWVSLSIFKIHDEAFLIFIFVIPLILYLILWDKISEFSMFGISSKLISLSKQTIDKTIDNFQPIEIIKGSEEEFTAQMRLLPTEDTAKPMVLIVVVGEISYNRQLLRNYIQYFAIYPNFKYIIFTDDNHNFLGFLRINDFLGCFDQIEYSKIFSIINRNYVEYVKNIPFIKTYSINFDSTVLQTLKKLTFYNAECLAVVKNGKFIGLIEREQIQSELLLKITE